MTMPAPFADAPDRMAVLPASITVPDRPVVALKGWLSVLDLPAGAGWA